MAVRLALFALVALRSLVRGSLLQSSRILHKSELGSQTTLGVADATRRSALFEWAEQHNASGLQSLNFADFVHGSIEIRGVASNAQYAPKDVVFRIPTELTIRPSQADAVFTPDLIASLDSAMSGSSLEYCPIKLALLLALERTDTESFWKPYLDQLPTLEMYRNFHPMLASDAVLSAFEGMPIIGRIRREKDLLEKAWHVCQKSRANSSSSDQSSLIKISKDEFMRGYVNVMTHAIRGVMVPIFDSLNCGIKQRQNVKAVGCIKFVDMFGYMEVQAIRSIKASEELLNYYSTDFDNEAFLLHWGFLDSANEHGVPSLNADLCSKLSAQSAGASVQAMSLAALAAEHCSD